jgi:hypothetical protein
MMNRMPTLWYDIRLLPLDPKVRSHPFHTHGTLVRFNLLHIGTDDQRQRRRSPRRQMRRVP